MTDGARTLSSRMRRSLAAERSRLNGSAASAAPPEEEPAGTRAQAHNHDAPGGDRPTGPWPPSPTRFRRGHMLCACASEGHAPASLCHNFRHLYLPYLPNSGDPDVKRERSPRLGYDDGAGRRPSTPTSTVRSAKPCADHRPCRTVEPSPTNVLRTPLARTGHVTHQGVEDASGRFDRCPDIQVPFRHSRKGTNRAQPLPSGGRVHEAGTAMPSSADVPIATMRIANYRSARAFE